MVTQSVSSIAEEKIQDLPEGDQSINPQPSLDGVMSLVEKDLHQVNRVILDNLNSDISLIPELARHLIAAGGKRIRPLMTLLSAKVFGYKGTRHIDLSACVEFIHTATLLHDDVVDESDCRRGKSSANAIWGNQASVLVGDFLFARAFQLMVQDGDLKVLKILCDASAQIAEGEVFQLSTAGDIDLSLDDYFKVIRSKTAVLFAAATQVGAVVSNAEEKDQEAMANLGLHIGILFQLMDDILDYQGNRELFGKNIGNDFREGKVTLPLILMIQAVGDTQKPFWQRTIANHDQLPGDFEQVQNWMQEHKIFEKCQDFCQKEVDVCLAVLKNFPENEANQALKDVVNFCMNRVT